MGKVDIILANGGLGGTLQTNDGVAGMVLTGGIDGTGDYALGTPILLTSYTKLTAAGITIDGNEFAVKEVKAFYDMAGDGAKLYLMLVPNTMTVDMMADKDNADGAKKLLDYAGGKIKLLGLMTDDSTIDTPTITNALNADVYTAITNMELLAAVYFAAQKPFRAIIGGTSYSGVAGDLPDLRERSDNRTAILIGDTVSGVNACLGLLLGTAAGLPVQRKISRVKNGALPITAAYAGTATVEATGTDMEVIAGNGFITFTTYPNLAGYFFSGDPMATTTTDDYCMLVRGRVIDKLHVIAYLVFVQEVDDEVFVVAGKLSPGYCKSLSKTIENQVNNIMSANKEISSFTCFIDPAQNVISTNKLAVVLKAVPVGYATSLEITLMLDNPGN